jgi:putative oxidoreductase
MNLKTMTFKARELIESSLGWFPPILTRLSLGILFLETGWGKVHNFEKVIEYFTSLGIPAPSFNAHFVGFTELICGTLLLIGLATRLASIPLIISMIVAVITAKRSDIHGLTDLFGVSEYLYVVLLSWLVIYGPGPLSLDRLIFDGSSSENNNSGNDENI